MPSPRRQIGFIASVYKSGLRKFLWPEGALAVLIGIGGGAALIKWGTTAERVGAVGDSLLLIGVLLGVVFAAYSLLIALFTDDYIRFLEKAEGGVETFLRPYMVAIGVQVIVIFIAIGYRASVDHIGTGIEKAWFLIWAFSFSYALLDVVALARNVTLHGLYKAKLAMMTEEQDSLRDSSSGAEEN